VKILSVSLENFASYKKLDFEFDSQGLALIHGPTGSGKSTLCDAIPWVMFGVTAKGGKVDEVLSWPGNEIASGSTVFVKDEIVYEIVRARGPKAKDNDLSWSILTDGIALRGKDIPDTQRLINQLLGMDADLYLSGAYYHEFSKTAGFFTTTAKARRELAEQLVDLDLPKTLQIKSSEAKKQAEIELQKTERKLERTTSNLELLKERAVALNLNIDTWEDNHQLKKDKALAAYHSWDNTLRTRLEELNKELVTIEQIALPPASFHNRKMAIQLEMSILPPDTCDKCGARKHNHKLDELRQQLQTLEKEALKNETYLVKRSNVAFNIKTHSAQENCYGGMLLELEAETNPHRPDLATTIQRIEEHKGDIVRHEVALQSHKINLGDLKQLSDVINDFRAHLVKSTIGDLEAKTNDLLTKHFDAEIRVDFTTAENDKIDVTIMKDGNQCVYSQLSKGQRQLLKLTFGVSVMRVVANHHGLQFNAAFVDEGFDGLSEEFKIKAYGLLQTLALDYDSLFVVEHSSELKALFEKQFEVSMTADGSQIGEY
jgi:DNA repair exonuclease SbcCD ATPase subunit